MYLKMEKIIIVLVIYLSGFLSKSFAQTNADPVYDSVKNLNLDHYATLPVDSLLQIIPKSYDFMQLVGTLKPSGRVRGLVIHYPGSMTIMIEPKLYNYMNPFDTNNVWDINLFKKEIAYYILIIHPDYDGIVGTAH